MNFVYDLLRAGTTIEDSDTGAQVAEKFNGNFEKVKTALESLEADVKENSVRSLKVGSTELDLDHGVVTIPFASPSHAGAIVSGTNENQIHVGDDGIAEVLSLNVSRLVQDSGDYLIFDGATASIS